MTLLETTATVRSQWFHNAVQNRSKRYSRAQIRRVAQAVSIPITVHKPTYGTWTPLFVAMQ